MNAMVDAAGDPSGAAAGAGGDTPIWVLLDSTNPPSLCVQLCRQRIGRRSGQGARAVPEIDGSAAIATLALVVGIGLLICDRSIHRRWTPREPLGRDDRIGPSELFAFSAGDGKLARGGRFEPLG